MSLNFCYVAVCVFTLVSALDFFFFECFLRACFRTLININNNQSFLLAWPGVGREKCVSEFIGGCIYRHSDPSLSVLFPSGARTAVWV